MADYETQQAPDNPTWRGQIICEPKFDVALQSVYLTHFVANQGKYDKCRQVAANKLAIGSIAYRTRVPCTLHFILCDSP